MSTLIPGSRIGAFPYEIVKILDNAGGMSETYLARVQAPEGGEASEVVLKLAVGRHQEKQSLYQATLENEVERLRRLKHPGIVRLFPIQRDGLPNLPYIAEASGLVGKPLFSIMEYLGGGSLKALIEQKRLDTGTALEITRSMAATLDYLHSRDQVHLDLKPDNILFRVAPVPGEAVEPVLIDFGIASSIGQRGLVAHTLEYAAPERVETQSLGESAAPPHPAMDIYALGVVLYELLTGSLPYDGRDTKKLSDAILRGNPKPPSLHNNKINQDLDALVLQMLSKDARARPAAVDVAIRLEQVAIKAHYRSRYPSRTHPSKSMAAPARSSASGSRMLLATLVVLLVGLIFFIVGTYPYWQGQIDANQAGLIQLIENVRQLIVVRISGG